MQTPRTNETHTINAASGTHLPRPYSVYVGACRNRVILVHVKSMLRHECQLGLFPQSVQYQRVLMSGKLSPVSPQPRPTIPVHHSNTGRTTTRCCRRVHTVSRNDSDCISRTPQLSLSNLLGNISSVQRSCRVESNGKVVKGSRDWEGAVLAHF
jgi:hypothetical protein